jgi:hypothetical protein
LIIGDANEGGEPEKNQVGVAYFTDPSGACFFDDSTICATEDITVHFESGLLGDMQVARLPLTHRWKVARAVQNFLNWADVVSPTDRALFAVGDVEFGGNSPQGLPELMDGLISQFESNGFQTKYMRDSDYDFEDMETRQMDMADSLNLGVDILINIGVVSSRWRLGGDFICEVCEPSWQMNWLDNSGPRPFVLFAPTCDLSDFDRDNPTYENPLAEQFLYNDPDKPAAVAWISHGRGNWKTYYMIFAEEFVAQLFSGDAIDLLDCYWKTKKSCWIKYPEMHNYLLGLFYLGWPVTLRGTCTSGADDAPTVPATLTLRVSPNPAMSLVALNFGLPRSGPVKIEVFDVQGRRVIVLADSHYEAGWQETTWCGRNSAGRSVASGMYFARITTERKAATAKFILIE